MNSVLTNQEPMALISYMETYLKHTTPDITLFSEEKFEIAVHKEIFYQTQLMRTMIRSADPDHCCSKVSLTCLIPRKDLEMIVQFLYSGVAKHPSPPTMCLKGKGLIRENHYQHRSLRLTCGTG